MMLNATIRKIVAIWSGPERVNTALLTGWSTPINHITNNREIVYLPELYWSLTCCTDIIQAFQKYCYDEATSSDM